MENKENKKIYCCDKMKKEEWFVEKSNGKIILCEDYSCHFIENAKYCPWCGNDLNDVIKK